MGEEGRLGKGIQAGGRKVVSGPLRVWARGENSALELGGARYSWNLTALPPQSRSQTERRQTPTIPAQVKAQFPSSPSPSPPHPHTYSSHQPATDDHSFPVTDPVKAGESRPSGLQKEAVQKEELAPKESQWRYQLTSQGP